VSQVGDLLLGPTRKAVHRAFDSIGSRVTVLEVI
jgi:hypothetical protein